ncbi:MAG: tetraacyldisaccharide 4'-kinase [Flavobacteriaceae bacterium]|nr:tetraacyldisaccharide 4'-kinase [Flavobacteriaceae bacterium]NVJ72512.1 tetraacyldisaccharide 4'-kinase [Flavobacteriaceae bacterium]
MNLRTVLLFPLSLKYAFVVFFRNKFYDWGLYKSHSFIIPTICVGNISLGGTGKTPMIDLLINHFQNKKVVVLSRGYGRKSKGLIHANSNSTALQIGDEPKQLLDMHPEIELVVSESRVKGMRYIESQIKPDLVLLDDAFQHRSLKAKVNILLTTYSKPYFKDYYLPLGTLRDHRISVKRADMLVVTKAPKQVCLTDKSEFKSRFSAVKPVYFAHIEYADHCIGEASTLSIEELKDLKVNLVTGIANPRPLLDYLVQKGIEVTHFDFKDHHQYTENDVEQICHNADVILTTQKDFVKLKGRCDYLYYLGIQHQIEQEDSFFNSLDQLLNS